ncbi:hypothetical protein DB30_03740 [Enhygromyxa salina]|uniref:Sulfotransferase domain protein n=1 Tax=Enhygromyxa salina TaxID=215803 RepID=A0A0C2A166_9BACT|nr:sulfotransferase [Enhygromyxa salina]KIG17143.1 hypothetical protein DB30_03740 [Enhygromyxa salina]
MALSLDAQQLLGAAAQRFAVEAPLEPAFEPALAALTKALTQEARLSPAGLAHTHERLIALLGDRVALAELERREPSITALPVSRPIVITGFPRTGTTLLQNLLARVEGLWAPPLWQLRSPIPPANVNDEAWAQQQRDDTHAMIEALYAAAPSFRSIHPMDPEWPDQCNLLLRKSFSTMANAFTWYVPSYVQFLSSSDMRPAYADHQRWLRALLHRRQRLQGDLPRLALKDPFHMWHTEALLAVYPDATIVHLHREPAQVVPSFASLCESLQSVDADSPRRPAEIGRFCLYILDHGLTALEQARQKLPAARFIDLSYRELVASPGATLRKLGAQLGFDATGVAVEEAGEWLERNRQHKLGRHQYSLDDFGLTEEVIDEYFAAYRARFGRHL